MSNQQNTKSKINLSAAARAQESVSLIECPRDAMQGWKTFIPTEKKVAYINSLLQVGFDTIDFGSFVSAKAIPQMQDTKEVVQQLDMSRTTSKLLAIVANVRGAEEAAEYDAITYLGFPFSVSETFQQRNTHGSIADAVMRVAEIQKICTATSKQLVVYISMGFGNPYGDAYSEKIVFDRVEKLVHSGVQIISLADTVGVATPEQVQRITSYLIQSLPGEQIGVHLHSTHNHWKEKIEAAFTAGCRRFDGALKGIGGCPMAKDDLVGNMNTEWLIDYFTKNNMRLHINQQALQQSLQLADEIFV